MKTRKTFLILLGAGLLTLSGCNLLNKGQEVADDASRDTERKTNDATEDAKNLTVFDNDGHFRIQKLYHFTNSEAHTQIEYTFKTDGALEMKNIDNDETTSYTYKANSNLIEIKDSKGTIEYIDYCDDVLFHPVNMGFSSREGYKIFVGGATGYLDGVVISGKSKSKVVGYHFDLQVSLGENKSVFTRDKATTTGLMYTIYADAHIDLSLKNSDVKYIDDSMVLENIDSSKIGSKVIDVGTSNKTYKAVLRVCAAPANTSNSVNSEGHFTNETIFHLKHSTSGEKIEYTFAPSGTLTTKFVWNDTTATYTYKVDSNLIEITDASGNVEYLDYYENVLFHGTYEKDASVVGKYTFKNEGYVGYLDGYPAALRSSSTAIGYHFALNVNVGDAKSVFTNSKSTSKGLYYKIFENATVKPETSNSNYVSSSMIKVDIDTSTAGINFTTVTLNSKEYKAPLRVAAVA